MEDEPISNELKDNHDSPGATADAEYEERFPSQAEIRELKLAA